MNSPKNLISNTDKILVTGAKGFLGKYLCYALEKQGYTNLVKLGTSKDVDLCYRENVTHIFANTKPDIVVHLAAKVGGIKENNDNAGIFFRDNLQMGMNVIEAAKNWKCKKFLLMGTVCSYAKHCPTPFHEKDLYYHGEPEESNKSYGIAKKTLTEMLSAYRKQWGLAGITIIPTNIYGEGQSDTHVISEVIRKIWKAKQNNIDSITLYGTGKASRDFLHVEDCVNGIIKALEIYDCEFPINLGTCNTWGIDYVVHYIANLMGYKGTFVWSNDGLDGQPIRLVSYEWAKKVLDWEPKINFKDGLTRTVNHFLLNTIFFK